jgi:hypothetical protein
LEKDKKMKPKILVNKSDSTFRVSLEYEKNDYHHYTHRIGKVHVELYVDYRMRQFSIIPGDSVKREDFKFKNQETEINKNIAVARCILAATRYAKQLLETHKQKS